MMFKRKRRRNQAFLFYLIYFERSRCFSIRLSNYFQAMHRPSYKQI